MEKEEVYLDLRKLTSEQLMNVAECVKHEINTSTYFDLSKGINNWYFLIYNNDWTRADRRPGRKEITYSEFLVNFGVQLPQSITLPIEDYNRLRKLEIEQEIKRLKRELKKL